MQCLAFCTATSYHIKTLYETLKTRFNPTLYRDVIHIEVTQPETGLQADLFYFSYGALISWGLSKNEVLPFLKEVKPFEHLPLEEMEIDEFTFIYGTTPKVVEDEIILPNQNVLSKLAISNAVAQSVKLGSFEVIIKKTFRHTEYIPENLAKFGRISLSRGEIRRKMGELFIERNSINRHVNILDVPEFFWKYPELEPLYRMMANYLDLEKRGEVLNQRLTSVHELFEMLGKELNLQHSNSLELIVIYLIVIKVLVSLFYHVFKIL